MYSFFCFLSLRTGNRARALCALVFKLESVVFYIIRYIFLSFAIGL